MSTAFLRSTSETLRYQNRWLSDSKWHELVKESYFGNGKQDQAEALQCDQEIENGRKVYMILLHLTQQVSSGMRLNPGIQVGHAGK
jgi:hypothetical protein